MTDPRSLSSLFSEPVDTVFTGVPVGASVRLVQAGVGVPVMTRAEVVRVERGSVELVLADRAALGVGARLILEPIAGDGPRQILAVSSVSGRSLTARVVGASARDRREYPRLSGRIDVRYRVATSNADLDAWMRGEDVPRVEHVPSPWMEFSATGLAFEELASAADSFTHDGDDLLMDMRLPGYRTHWRCIARVIRVLPAHPAPGDAAPGARYRVAVNFDQIPKEATIAFARYTLQVQEAMMDGVEDIS